MNAIPAMREELKYVLPVELLADLRRALSPYVVADAHAVGYEERGYTVRSIYLDSPRLLYYHEKIGHLQHRKKIRIRGYNNHTENERVFLEIKRKSGSAISKERAPIRYADLQAFFERGAYRPPPSGAGVHAAAVARRVCFHVLRNDLRPTSLVVYEREAFEATFDSTFRVTLDRNLRGRMYPDLHELFEEESLLEATPGFFIMEVKFNTRMPAWMRQIIGEFALMQRAASKYCICVDAAERRVDTRAAVLASTTAIAGKEPETELTADIRA